MPIYTDRIVLVFPINDPNKTREAAASLQTLEITESGNEFEKLVPLDPDKVKDYSSEFSLPLIQENATLKTDNEKLSRDLTAVTLDRDSLQSQVDSLTTEKTQLAEDIAGNKTEIDLLKTQVEDLQKFRPYNPRIIDASKFFDRITKDEFAALSTSDDATLATIAKTIVAYKSNDWPVIFESQEMVGMLQYLVGVGFLTEERKSELIADASQEEAYNAD